jgi:hypothetical protein
VSWRARLNGPLTGLDLVDRGKYIIQERVPSVTQSNFSLGCLKQERRRTKGTRDYKDVDFEMTEQIYRQTSLIKEQHRLPDEYL